RMQVTERSAAALVDPTIIDTLPPELTFVSVDSLTYNNIPVAEQPAAAPTFSSGPPLKWQWSGWTLNPPATGVREIVIHITAQVNNFVAPNTYANSASFLSDSTGMICESGAQVDGSDLDTDGNTTEAVCQ